MSNEKDYLISLLMKNKAQLKMLDFIFENNSNADEEKMNAILDEKELKKTSGTLRKR